MVNGVSRKKWFMDDSKDTWRQAAEWEAAQKRLLQAENAPPTIGLSIFDWYSAYLDHVKPRVTHNTYREKVAAGQRFLGHLGANTSILDVTPGTVASFMNAQTGIRSGNAINDDRKNLATAWEYGRRYLNGFAATGNPFLQAEKMAEQRHPRYVPPEHDFWAVYDTLTGQDQIMLLTALHLALRRAELFGLTWADIDWTNSAVRVYTQKRRHGDREYDWLPLTTELRQALRKWWEDRPIKAAHVFTQLNDHQNLWSVTPGAPYKYRQHFMRRACESAGVKPFGFHAIRHLSASILYHAGYPLAVIQRILRHKSASTTERYLARLGLDGLRIDDQVFQRKPAAVIPLKSKKAI
jgi:integrase